MIEIIAVGLGSAIIGFLGGMKKLKSNCCCISCDIERDDQNHIQGIGIHKKNYNRSQVDINNTGSI